jgi:CheY-like chemotaxis protein
MGETNHMNRKYKKLIHDQRERLKELKCINQTTAILKEGKPIEESLRQIVHILPSAWQYPEFTVACIRYMDICAESTGFKESVWKMTHEFTTIDDETGTIEVFYTTEFSSEDEGPFLKEEKDLIQNVGSLITGYINSCKAKDIMRLSKQLNVKSDFEEVTSTKLLQKFLDRHNAERDVFHDLMPFRVKEILLIATLYDAYTIEGEGRFSDHILGEYYQLNLTSIPRVTGVSDEEEVFNRLKARHYDMIIIMVGADKETPMSLCRKIKDKYRYIPTFIILNNSADITYIKKQKSLGVPFDNYFIWTGESKVFFAMVNLLEDRTNVENDTKKGFTRVVLIVEDSAEYYSNYLPMLYSLVMEQTRSLIEDVSSDELYKVLKLRTRPKILLASDYEDAVAIFNKYKNYLLCVISDIRFPKNGVENSMAGYELIEHIRKELPNLPALLQSSDIENAKYAVTLKSHFIDKNSPNLLQDIKSFINYYLGFGNFVYRDTNGKQIAVAKSMKEFEAYLQTVPEDSLVYHSMKNHFSLWLMARGEVQIAKLINPVKISDFNSLKELREFLINLIRKRRTELNKGKIVNFDESAVIDDSNIVSLAAGSLGGKGRGLAFINTLIHSFEIGRLTPGIQIRIPITAIIGTDEFDLFMDQNHLWDVVKEKIDFETLQKMFFDGSLSDALQKKLKVYIRNINVPLAVRSSSLFEDSMYQPFSGIFGTYVLPNNDPDPEVRIKQLSDAIKLVFSSIYSKKARNYFNAVRYKVEQEKMAVVIQELVGKMHEDVFYPDISGTAQSFNFYPVAHMKPEDGFAVMAVGLGQYVVEGQRAFRFSPEYPTLDIISNKDLFRNSQVSFYAVDMAKKDINLLEGENASLISLSIIDAERHGTINHSTSVYNSDNDTISPGLDNPGPRIINFADILKYNYLPLARTIKKILDVVSEAFGTSVEIEFAVDMNKDNNGLASFYLLQIKPLVGSVAGHSVDQSDFSDSDVILFTKKSMGNGVIDTITDLIYLEPDSFNNLYTYEMSEEIDCINEKMVHDNTHYVLIGPGRWGTRDRYLGIPVTWPQISNAKIVVEISLPDFNLDASLGSHFFHNVIAMNVGYFSINNELDNGIINWDKLRQQKIVSRGKFFRHIKFKKPLLIQMDGKKGIGVITVTH